MKEGKKYSLKERPLTAFLDEKSPIPRFLNNSGKYIIVKCNKGSLTVSGTVDSVASRVPNQGELTVVHQSVAGGTKDRNTGPLIVSGTGDLAAKPSTQSRRVTRRPSIRLWEDQRLPSLSPSN